MLTPTPNFSRDALNCVNGRKTFEPAMKSSTSTKAGGYPRLTCPRCDIPCTLCTSSSPSNPGRMYYRYMNCTFFQWCYDYMKGMNYNVNFKHCNVQQRNQSQVSQEHLMFKPEPIIQQQTVDALWHLQQFLFFLCVTNAFVFVLLLLKSV
ncbi:hypothetical protein AMTRI_Chr03g141400 [Amborella trichopoda]